MNPNYLKVTLIALVTILSFSCSSEDSSSEETDETSETTTNTWVKLTAISTSGDEQPNYIIMMFDEAVTSSTNLPPIKKQVTTDANGLAYFDLNAMITGTTPTTYYFEAFVQEGTNYIWKSVSHPSFSIAKGQMITSSIIVN